MFIFFEIATTKLSNKHQHRSFIKNKHHSKHENVNGNVNGNVNDGITTVNVNIGNSIKNIAVNKTNIVSEDINIVSNDSNFGFPNKSEIPNGAIVVLTYNRPDLLMQTFNSLIRLPGLKAYKIYISQDGTHKQTIDSIQNNIINKYKGNYSIKHLMHPQLNATNKKVASTIKLASHYKFMFTKIFDEYNHSHVIILEDDMIFSYDFLEFFAGTVKFLNNINEKVFCISSWNDYGYNFLDYNNKLLHRTDFFPGLGWMTNKYVWNEIKHLFPRDHWDHFMRLDTIYKNRTCIYPSLSRNFNIGDHGSTIQKKFYRKYLKTIRFNKNSLINFKNMDLSYLNMNNYDNNLIQLIKKSTYIGTFSSQSKLSNINQFISKFNNHGNNTYLISFEYYFWDTISKRLNILGSQRTKYKHTIILYKNGNTFIFCNERLSPFLKYSPNKNLFIKKNTNITIATGKLGNSCDKTCKDINKKCISTHFEYLNQCSVLQKYFGCNECVGSVIGKDLPNFVVNGNEYLKGLCLTTEGQMKCNGKHKTTKRICPCI